MAVWFNCYHAVYSSIPHLGLLFEIYIQLLWLVFKSKAYCRSVDFNENYFSRCNFRTSKGGSDWTGQIRDQKAITRLYCFLFFWFPSSCELVCWKDTQPSIARLSEQAVKRSQHSLLILLTSSDINTSSLSWLSNAQWACIYIVHVSHGLSFIKDDWPPTVIWRDWENSLRP